ncbi:MAG: hypothetical protein IPO00_07590 [Betaproteobacteria bacterium]|nr:hypothetical protein [Betaproteobacteria bacterium]
MSRKFFLTPVHLVPALLLIFALAGCGSVPPAPADNFYRLQTPAAAATQLPVAVEIRRVQADSLYAERPIVYSEAGNPRQLRQYHYHLWLYPPAQMLRDASRSVADTSHSQRQDRDAGRPHRRLLIASSAATTAAHRPPPRSDRHFRQPDADRERHQAEQASSDATLTAFVVAMEGALGASMRKLREMAEKAAR